MGNDDGPGSNSGYIRIFEINATEYIQRGQALIGAAENDHLHTSLTMNIDGMVIAFGSIFNDGTGRNAGQSWVFKFSRADYVHQSPDIDLKSTDDNFWEIS